MIRLTEKTIGIIGQKGTGKTFFTRRLIETIKRPTIVFDTIGAINPKKCYQFDAGGSKLTDQAITFGMAIVEAKKHCISIDLSNLHHDEIISFVDTALITAHTNIKNRWIFVDEVSEMLSQMYSQSRELERLIRHGRNYGNTFVFNTQRPAYLNKRTWNLTDIVIVFRINWKHDLEVVKELLSNLGMSEKEVKEHIQTITTQERGEYQIYSLS